MGGLLSILLEKMQFTRHTNLVLLLPLSSPPIKIPLSISFVLQLELNLVMTYKCLISLVEYEKILEINMICMPNCIW